MVEVYYYLPVEEVTHAVECGLKLSKHYDKEVLIQGESRKCISALINPRDDLEKYRSERLRCVKLELPYDYCYVADKSLYEVGLNSSEAMELYRRSVVPVQEYKFGMYRLPECLVVSTIIPGQISVLSKMLDSPILYHNSEELYINNIIENYKDGHGYFNDAMLYSFYSRLAKTEKIDKIEDNNSGIAVFIDKETGRSAVIRIPDMDEYKL